MAFSQKNESFSFDCASNNYSFTGIRIGETIKPGVNGNEYYYENADGKTAFIYRIQYYNNKIFIVHKVIIPISGKLDKLTLAKMDNFTFNINSSYEDLKIPKKNATVMTEKSAPAKVISFLYMVSALQTMLKKQNFKSYWIN